MQNFVKIIIRRQKEEIDYLKREVRRLKRERRAYRTFYLKTMNRYCGLFGVFQKKTGAAMTYLWEFLEAHRVKYPVVCKDPSAIVEDKDSEIPNPNETLR
jgi:hypothetical protein